MNHLIIMVGFPGSGKTTYAKQLKNILCSAVYHSSDSIRKEIYGDEAEQYDPRIVFDIMQKRTILDLKLGYDVIYDATNLFERDRKTIFEAVQNAELSVEIIAIVMDTEISTCKQNNQKRNRHVSEHVYDRMQKRFLMPSLEEGFDQIITVNQQQKEKPSRYTKSHSKYDIEYLGVFFDNSVILPAIERNIKISSLEKQIDHLHTTLQYAPDFIPWNLFGKKAEIKVIGYGNDGFNEGLQVELSSKDPELKQYMKSVKIPHITLSVNKNGKAVNTRYLDFQPIEPFAISGLFGGCAGDGVIITNGKAEK